MFVVCAAVGVEADPRTGGKLFFAHEEMCNAAQKKYNNRVHYSPYINTSETTLRLLFSELSNSATQILGQKLLSGLAYSNIGLDDDVRRIGSRVVC